MFSEAILKRVEFESCRFHNCKITDSNLEKVDFDDTSLNYCQFKKIFLLAGYFNDCWINESNFEEINSYGVCAIIVDSQISKFNWSINLKGDFNFDDLLKFLKSISPSEAIKIFKEIKKFRMVWISLFLWIGSI